MSQSQEATAAPRRRVHDFVCTACGCTCDDLRLTIEGRRIIAVEPPCPLAEKFLLQEVEPPPAACLVDGQPAELDAALERAAEFLSAASAPLVMGFERATTEAQRLAIEIADRLGAVLDPTSDQGRSRSHIAVQTAGAVTATLGEIAARSDLIVYWNVDPATTHPRHIERFARRPRTVKDGTQSSRRIITVAPERNKTSQASDEHLGLGVGSDIAAFAILRALVKGVSVDATHAEAQTGAPLEQWAYLAQRLKMAQYAAIFFEPSAREGEAPAEPGSVYRSAVQQEPCPPGSDPAAVSQSITELVRELHRYTRAVALRLGDPWNAVSAAQVLTWQTGFPASVSFTAGFPQYLPGEASAQVLLERGEVDAVMIIGADPLAQWPKDAANRLANLPTVVIDNHQTETSRAAQVAIFTARFGIETTGSVYRSDGVALPLRAAVSPQFPEAEVVLEQLSRQLLLRHSERSEESGNPSLRSG
ncbi:MAG TPA: molybdopterin-dependent oxidoreductase [Lacipirellula sp.]